MTTLQIWKMSARLAMKVNVPMRPSTHAPHATPLSNEMLSPQRINRRIVATNGHLVSPPLTKRCNLNKLIATNCSSLTTRLNEISKRLRLLKKTSSSLTYLPTA